MWASKVRKDELPEGQEEAPGCYESTVHGVKAAWTSTKEDYVHFYDELKDECTPSVRPASYYKELVQDTMKAWIHIPYLPALHRPGWFLRYVFGPFDSEWINLFVADFCAGLTVAFTLIPQALSYAALANLPAINGLYTAILPSTCYVFFGSSMQLAVGPVAVVSLMTGILVSHHQPDYATNTVAAVDTAAQAAFNVGILMTVMGILNLGSFIHFISHPVMSGFTTGAAMSIGLSQLNNAFGFSSSTAPYAAPKQGQEGYEYNYQVMQWLMKNFNEKYNFPKSNKNAALYNGKSLRNPYAMKICFGLCIPLLILIFIKQSITATPERKKRWSFKIWTLASSLMPFIGLIIATNQTWLIKTTSHPDPDDSFYVSQLKIVGAVVPGLNILRTPTFRHEFGAFFVDCIPLALVLYMESYAVARRIASINNELHILNASQELWANGTANLLGCISSGYPVSGSFSRSSLNFMSGAKTPMSKFVTMCIVLTALGSLTTSFFYIPQAALSAVIFVSINSLVNLSDVWEVFKHNKQDCLLMVTTIIITFVYETSYGLAVGIGLSALFYLANNAFSLKTAPYLVTAPHDAELSDQPKLSTELENMEHGAGEGLSSHGILVVKMQGDLTFVHSFKIKEFISDLILQEPAQPGSAASRSETLRYAVSSTLDMALRPRTAVGVRVVLPRAIVIDMAYVRLTDVTGLTALSEAMNDCRKKRVAVALINTTKEVGAEIYKFGIRSEEMETSAAASYLQQFIVPAEDGRMYVNFKDSNNNSKHETASEKKEQDRQRDESHNENDTTPLVSGDKVKPHSNSVTNRENFHVHGLYPPLGSLDGGSSVVPADERIDLHDNPLGSRSNDKNDKLM